MSTEGSSRGELAQLVADHRVGHEHRDVLASVVDGDRVPDHRGDDHRTARPCLDDVLGALVVLDVDLLLQVVVDEGALLEASWHGSAALSTLAGLAATDDHLVTGL